MDILENAELKMISSIDNLSERLTTIRAGRANPGMLNGINVEAYGVLSPINTLANIDYEKHSGRVFSCRDCMFKDTISIGLCPISLLSQFHIVR